MPNDDGTRLISRWRGMPSIGAGEKIASAVFGAMDFVMEQKMLRRIKELVERDVMPGPIKRVYE